MTGKAGTLRMRACREKPESARHGRVIRRTEPFVSVHGLLRGGPKEKAELKNNTVGPDFDMQGERDLLFADYASGKASPALAALVDAHLTLKPENRRFVAALEEVAGLAVEEGDPVPVSGRDARLAAIFDMVDAAPAGEGDPEDTLMPRSLRRFVGADIARVPWRTLLPGLKEYRIQDDDDGEVSLIWVRPGQAMPTHTHEGREVTLVLKGGFSDVTGHYRRGDIVIADEAVDHRPIADKDEDCICFAVTEAPVRLTGPIGGLLGRLFGR